MKKNKLAQAVVHAIYLVGITSLSLPGMAYCAEASASANNPALKALFDQAAYWHERAHDELAKGALNKVLLVDPNNTQALYLMSLYSLQSGNKAEANQWRDKLVSLSPQDPHLAELNNAKALQSVPQEQLASARKLASQGNIPAALQAYNALFNGSTPIGSLAPEYYLTMAGDRNLQAAAIQGLQQRVAEHPDDSPSKLALGKILTYKESSRRDGVTLLSSLADNNSDADRALRQALLWMTPQEGDRAIYQGYQARHPNDTSVMAYFDKNIGGEAKNQGFKDLNGGNTNDARKKFESILAANPSDADALAGMGYIAQRSGNFEQAADYLSRAAQQGGSNSGELSTQAQDASFYAQLAKAQHAQANGNYDTALSLVEPLTQSAGDKGVSASLLRADILKRKGDLAGAEQAYRALGDNQDARAGLYFVLRQENKAGEAAQILPSLPASLRAKMQGPAYIDVIEPLRRQAQQAASAGDTQRALNLLQQAREKQPSNIWVKLDMARILEKQGNHVQAQALMNDAARPGASATEIYAAALFASESKQWPLTEALLARIPAGSQNQAMQELAQRANFNRQIKAAESYLQQGNSIAAANTLRALAKNPPSTPADVGALAKDLAAAGDLPTAVSLVRQSQQQGIDGTAGDYADQISVLNQAGLTNEAQTILQDPKVQGSSTPTQLSNLQNGFIINQVDQLREQGQYAAAYDKLVVALQADPKNRDLMLAMARLYQSGKMNKEAGQVYNYLMSNDTPNQDARVGAINIALADNDIPRAQELMDGLKGPRTPDRLLLAARLAEAQGDHQQALALLRSAKGKMIGLDGADSGSRIGGLQLSDNPFLNRSSKTSRANNGSVYGTVLPWQQGTTASNGMGSPVLPGTMTAGVPTQSERTAKQIDDMLDTLQEKTATWVQGDLSVRGRQGDSGLSQLTEAKAPMTFAFVPFETSRLSFSATPVTLSGGSTSGTNNALFGQGALSQALSARKDVLAAATAAGLNINDYSTFSKLQTAATTAYAANCTSLTAGSSTCSGYTTIINTDPTTYSAPSSGNQNGSGVELALALTGDQYKVDIGSTPLGQDLSGLVGGLQWAPKLGDYTTLTMTAERRAVTDSILAYVGTKDTYSGNSWGQVTKNGINLNLSYDNGDAGFYAGAGLYSYLGTNVASNKGVIANTGLYLRPYRYDDRELKAGVNIGYMNFDKNLSYYSYGQGGYFSPQNYVSVSFPVEYTQKYDDWDFKLHGAVGYQSYTEDKSAYYPNNPELQSQLEQLVSAGYASTAYYPGQTKNGIGWNMGVGGNYHLNKKMQIGGDVSYDTFGQYKESRANVYFRYMLDGK